MKHNALTEGNTLHVPVPTFNPETGPREYQNRLVAISHEGTGLRIILDDNGTETTHDLLIEHHPDKWVILLHANASDVACAICITDRKLTVEDTYGLPVLSKVVEKVKPEMESPYACDRCNAIYDEARGDGYCGLCPSCADQTDNHVEPENSLLAVARQAVEYLREAKMKPYFVQHADEVIQTHRRSQP